MAKYAKNRDTTSEEVKQEAMKAAKATQKSGQTKEQTKLIAQGIQKGIEQYKKQQKAKARELDKQLKRARNSEPEALVQTREIQVIKQHWLPWVLLGCSWLGFLGYVVLSG